MLTHIGTDTIETERLILRKFKISDDEAMLNIGLPMKKFNLCIPNLFTPQKQKLMNFSKNISIRIKKMITTVGQS